MQRKNLIKQILNENINEIISEYLKDMYLPTMLDMWKSTMNPPYYYLNDLPIYPLTFEVDGEVYVNFDIVDMIAKKNKMRWNDVFVDLLEGVSESYYRLPIEYGVRDADAFLKWFYNEIIKGARKKLNDEGQVVDVFKPKIPPIFGSHGYNANLFADYFLPYFHNIPITLP